MNDTSGKRFNLDSVTVNKRHKKRGRPLIGTAPMTVAERKRRSRANRKKAWEDLSPELRFRHELLAFFDRYFVFRKNHISVEILAQTLEAWIKIEKLIAYEAHLEEQGVTMAEQKIIYGEGFPSDPIALFLAGTFDGEITTRRFFRMMEIGSPSTS
jgi:hypothetical protein